MSLGTPVHLEALNFSVTPLNFAIVVRRVFNLSVTVLHLLSLLYEERSICPLLRRELYYLIPLCMTARWSYLSLPSFRLSCVFVIVYIYRCTGMPTLFIYV
jgi:hypothetical protein